ncbi:uncharacterized protein LOC123402355 isoform X2 [Hordeum vulgare subsp. vulgare]|uniref:uncharacterized protein LOC123402355 isoform X2 n=1 Tax=Hordeum vulgare subsp. vulgare TaxID=112509 RepID=UPI001D1A32B7|nr:uncharacterized protein LOC123402355 isoform X2 [Hordeum vulgare subsp. vulgare]
MEWTNLHSPVPNMEQFDLGAESEGGSAESEYVVDSEESEDASDGSEEEEQPPPCREPRSKQRHDPVAAPSKTVTSSSRNVKRDRAAATDSVEKAAKQPKPDAPKLRKALPRMRIVLTVTSVAVTSVSTSVGTGDDHMDLEVVDKPAPRPDVSFLDDEQEPQHTAAEQTLVEPVTSALGMPVTPAPSVPPVGSGAMATTPPTGSTIVPTVLSAPPVTQATTAMMPTSSSLAFSLHRVLEEHTGAAKEAMIQAELMMQRTKEVFEASKLAYDASSALQANIRVSSTACEIGSQYTQMESKKNQLQLEYDTMKKVLEDTDLVLAKLKEKSKADEQKLADFNRLVAENEKMKKERDVWAKKLDFMAKRGNTIEKFVKDFLAKMLATLIGTFSLPSVFVQISPNEM